MTTTDLAAWATICGLMTVFLSLGVAALRACVIPQDTDSPPWVAVEIGAQLLAVVTGILGVWIAMSQQWDSTMQLLGIIAGLSFVALITCLFALGGIKRIRARKSS